jgi:hypothetical protein
MIKRRATKLYCYLDGEKYFDVVTVALLANVSVSEAKKLLIKRFPHMKVTFKSK